MMNKYGRLNLFNGYSHIENNVSRIFARILQDNQYVLDEFVDLIKAKSTKEINDVSFKEINNSTYKVEFQKTIEKVKIELKENNENLNKYNSIIGVALTPIEGAQLIDIDSIKVNNTDRKEGITDIVIENFSNTYILIECKNVNNDAIHQTKSYLYQIDGVPEDNKQIVSISWTEVIDILQKYSDLKFNQDVILEEYLDWLKNEYITWFPVKKFSKDNLEEENKKRLKSAINNINKLINNDNQFIINTQNGAIVNLVNDFQNNAYFNVNNNSIYMESCIADTKGQMNLLLKKCEKFNFLNIKDKDSEYVASVVSYIKASDAYGGGISWKEIQAIDKNTFINYKDNYCKRIALDDIKNQTPEYNKLPNEFKELLQDKSIINSKRSFVNLSCGYKIRFTFNWEMIMNLDKNFNFCTDSNNDEVAKYLINFINEILKNYII